MGSYDVANYCSSDCIRVVSIVGARPNLMKVAPIVAELGRHPGIESVLVHTGQHYDPNMSDVFFHELGIPNPAYNLGIGSASNTAQTAHIMLALEPLLLELRPDVVIVVGDVNSTMAATLVAAKLGIRVAHVEAGLRSFDRTMPEEINRIVTDSLADFLFTTEHSGNENLRREGVTDDKVFFVGNVMIDTLLQQRPRAEALNMPARLGLSAGNYVLLTLHRPSNVDSFSVLAGIFAAIEVIQSRIPIVFPVHPRTRKRLEETALLQQVECLPRLRLVEPLGYLEFLALMTAARLVMTDSGGIQEETTVLGVPCLTLRENTERPVTVTQGTNRLAGMNPDHIVSTVMDLLSSEVRHGHRPDLWDGHAAERIVAILLDRIRPRSNESEQL